MSLTVSLTALGSSRRDQIDRIIEAGLIEKGRVFALSLQPVRASLDDRWEHRKEQVWDAAERTLEKRLPPPDVFLRVDDTTFLAAIASTNPYDGQVRCAEILRTLLHFFLGRSADDDIVLTRVSDLSDKGMRCERIDPLSPRLLNEDEGRAPLDVQPVSRPPEDWVPPLAGRRHALTIHTASDGPAEIELEITPVWRLDQGLVCAFRINRTFRGIQAPTAAQSEAMDQATIDFLLPLLEEYRREGGVFALIAPLSFTTLSPSRPRLSLIGRWSEVSDLMRQVVILEMEGVDPGVPTGRAGVTAAMLAPFFRGLMVQVGDVTTASTVLREHAFNGATIDLSRLGRRSGLGGLITSVRRFTRNIVLLNPPRALGEGVLASSGVSHVVWPDDGDAAGPRDQAVTPDASAPA